MQSLLSSHQLCHIHHLWLLKQILVQLHLELEVNLLVHNVFEREIDREKVQMKPPSSAFYSRDWGRQEVRFCTA